SRALERFASSPRTADVGKAPVADALREDRDEARALRVARHPRAVHPSGDRRVDGLEPALEDSALDRAARDSACGAVEREKRRAGARRLVVEDTVPYVVAVRDLGAVGGETAIDRARRL